MSGKLFLFLLLGATFLISADSAKAPSRRNDDIEESCEEDGDNYDSQGRPKNVGSSRPKERKASADDWDGVEDPTDDDYLRYENSNQEGICLLERGKCPQGNWRLFKRRNESVCLKVIGRPHPVDSMTAATICRQNANSRLMTVDNHEERAWILSTPLGGNGSYPHLLTAGYRNRKCQMNPFSCQDKQSAFNEVDGTSDHKYIYSRWNPGVHNAYTLGYLDNCILFYTSTLLITDNYLIRDFACNSYNTFLCGVTVM